MTRLLDLFLASVALALMLCFAGLCLALTVAGWITGSEPPENR